MTFEVPCRRPENDSEDWFIDKNGVQYADEPILTEAEVRVLERVADQGAPYDEGDSWNEALARLKAEAEAEKIRLALIRRRQAKDKCFVDCILREHCLEAGLEMPHGTWGGYYEEERAKIVRLRDQRRAEREGAGR